jgi:nucleoside-diphosphate kinase
MAQHIEQTLVIYKPHAVQRAIIGEILSRFERAGLKIIGMKMLRPTEEQYHYHYETIGTMITRHGEKIFKNTLAMMQDAPVIAVVLEGVKAVEVVRKMTGATEPKSALPGTIRGDYAHMNYGHSDEQEYGLHNIIHASGSLEEAKPEIEHWFKPEELFAYDSVHDISSQKISKK